MPMLDAYIPEGALSASAEKDLIAKLTDILLHHEGVDPTDPAARSIAWVFLHRPEVFVAGEAVGEPRYRIIASVPEGQFDEERRQAIVGAITEAVLDAEDGAHERNPLRVWVFANEVPEGTWGAGGRIVTLAGIVGFVTGDPEKGRRYAQARLAEREATDFQGSRRRGRYRRARSPKRTWSGGRDGPRLLERVTAGRLRRVSAS